MDPTNFGIKGLSNEQVEKSRDKYGINEMNFKKKNNFLDAVKGVAKEPIVLLLLAASSIYFVTGNFGISFSSIQFDNCRE